jgi:hypothetical protein
MTANEDLDRIEHDWDHGHGIDARDLRALIAELRSTRASIGPDSHEGWCQTRRACDCGKHVQRPVVMKDDQTYCSCGRPWPCPMAAPIGPDSERAELIIANALKPGAYPQDTPIVCAAALRAAGLLPGPDDIVVSREDVATLVSGAPGRAIDYLNAAANLRAALSQPHPAQEQPPPFNPDVELIGNREGNKREVRIYRRDAQEQQT